MTIIQKGERMSDLISRQAAIDAIGEVHPLDYNAQAIKTRIESLPSAQTMRKKGRWKRRLVDSGFNADWHCSECGWETAIEEHGYNYCPNCGADMREGQNE